MSFSQAFEGAKVELAGLPPAQRLQRIAVYARVIAAELMGTLAAVPFGLRAMTLYRSLPEAPALGLSASSSTSSSGRRSSSVAVKRGDTVSIMRNVRYGDRPRNVLDIYLPPLTPEELAAGSSLLPASAPLPADKAADSALLAGKKAASAGAGAAGAAAGVGQEAAQLPVVLFCHGGVWASGATWHYAPLASRLAQAGCITAVMTYTLFPEALVPQMTQEVGAALSWVLGNCRALGGDPRNVSLVGHSAGAHLCTMALLQRALAAGRKSSSGGELGGQQAVVAGAGSDEQQPGAAISPAAVAPTPATAAAAAGPPAAMVPGGGVLSGTSSGSGSTGADVRMPARLVGMAGVYDLGKHFEYEQGRDVHELSTMRRAVGGAQYFPSQSPAVILSAALSRPGKLQPEHTSWELLDVPAASAEGSCSEANDAAADTMQQHQPGSFYGSFRLRGEGIAQRIGFGRRGPAKPRTAAAAAVPAVARPAAVASSPAGSGSDGSSGNASTSSSDDRLLSQLTVDDVRRLPPTTLMSSCSDLTVPFYESSEYYWLLHDCGCPAKNLVYNRTGHGDFVVGWQPVPKLGPVPLQQTADLAPFAADLLSVVTGQVDGL